MNMRQNIILLAACAVLGAGCHSSSVRIEGRFVGTDAEAICLEHATPQLRTPVDSARLDETGRYAMVVKGVGRTPELYNLVVGGERIPLLLGAGDRVTVGAIGNVTRNYVVEGSGESVLLADFYRTYARGVQQLDSLAARYARETDDAERRRLMEEYAGGYRRIKREQLRFIVENKSSLAALYALYQRLPGDPYLLGSDSDIVYYRTVAEGLAASYPDSPYLEALEREIEQMEARQELFAGITEASYPDLEMTDMYGKKIRLSSLAGKVVLLDFWSAESGNSNALNAELKETYARYAARGFEIYQVAIDRSKTLWINAVQEQGLPWISVSDLQGRASAACRLYNLDRLPANFLIDRDGNLVARDLYGADLDRNLDLLLR